MIRINSDFEKFLKLQRRLLAHIDDGEITLEQFEWFISLSEKQRSKIFEIEKKKIVHSILEQDLGIIIAPTDSSGQKKYSKFLSKIKGDLKNRPSYTVKPGDTFQVHAYKVFKSNSITFEDELNVFLQNGSIALGIQGIALVIEQQRDLLTKDLYYFSPDKKENLPVEKNGEFHSMPGVKIDSDNSILITFSGLEEKIYHQVQRMLVFTKI